VTQQLAPATRSEPTLARTSLGLFAGKVLQMGAGFLFWVVAARGASVTDIGVVAASVSAVLLCTQVSVLGTGSAVIATVGRGAEPRRVLDTAFTILVVSGSLVGAAYVGGSLMLGGELGGAFLSPYFSAAFIVSTVAGTLLICLDQAGVAVGHGTGAITRYLVGGALSLLVVTVLVSSTVTPTAELVFTAWSLGAVGVCAWGAVQLRRWLRYRFRPRVAFAQSRRMLGAGLPNQLLTLAERLPALAVPVLVAHTLSPATTAYWYPAWMVAWVAFTVPVQVGIAQFDQGVRRPEDIGQVLRSGIFWSVTIGGAVAVAIVAAAELILQTMGPGYAESSADALRILTLGLVPYALWQGYNALCRAGQRLTEAIAANSVFAVVLTASTVAAAQRGVTTMAVTWVLVSGAAAAWPLVRMRRRVTADD